MGKRLQYWTLFNDGWFEYYICPCCGHKQQLKTDKTPLPLKCPSCEETLLVNYHVEY